jgi:sulfide:quinone oxidoreductase
LLEERRAPEEGESMKNEGSIHHRVVVVGGGTGGITVASRLLRKSPHLDLAIIEPSEKHYYQPLWTLVGGGIYPRTVTARDEASVIPPGAKWIKDAVKELRPDQNSLLTGDGGEVRYDFLVMAPGIQINWGKIKGLEACIGHDGVCSNYSYDTVESTWPFIRNFTGGTAIFTHPNTPIKCGGAPQKIAYLADHAFRKKGVREKSRLIYATGVGGMLPAKYYGDVLREVIARKGIEVYFMHNLLEIRPQSKEAVFEDLENKKPVVFPYDLLHATPPMSSPDFVAKSPLANEGGWVDVDKCTLQHKSYPNVFALGDASSLPTSKTGAAILRQAPIVVQHLLAAMEGKDLEGRYDGYTACPVVTGYGTLIMAEFGYEGIPMETFPFDQRKERLSMYLVKKYLLPRMYWYGMMKGIT